MNLIPLCSAHAYLQLTGSLPGFSTPCIQSIKEVKDLRPQCGKTLGLICLRQLCLEKFKPKCCLRCMWLSEDFEDKDLQTHLVISLQLMESARKCIAATRAFSSWVLTSSFVLFQSFWLLTHQQRTLELITSENVARCNPELSPGYRCWPTVKYSVKDWFRVTSTVTCGRTA